MFLRCSCCFFLKVAVVFKVLDLSLASSQVSSRVSMKRSGLETAIASGASYILFGGLKTLAGFAFDRITSTAGTTLRIENTAQTGRFSLQNPRYIYSYACRSRVIKRKLCSWLSSVLNDVLQPKFQKNH